MPVLKRFISCQNRTQPSRHWFPSSVVVLFSFGEKESVCATVEAIRNRHTYGTENPAESAVLNCRRESQRRLTLFYSNVLQSNANTHKHTQTQVKGTENGKQSQGFRKYHVFSNWWPSRFIPVLKNTQLLSCLTLLKKFNQCHKQWNGLTIE